MGRCDKLRRATGCQRSIVLQQLPTLVPRPGRSGAGPRLADTRVGHVFATEFEVTAAVGEGGADRKGGGALLAVAVCRDAALQIAFDTGEVLIKDEVHHACHGVRTPGSRSA